MNDEEKILWVPCDTLSHSKVLALCKMKIPENKEKETEVHVQEEQEA